MVRGVRTSVLGVGGACPPNNNLSIKHAIGAVLPPNLVTKPAIIPT